MSNKSLLLILLTVSIATHFAFFGNPNQTVFDEVHFGKFISGYYTHQYYFDIHPPLGKLIIAGFGKLFDFKPDPPAGEAGFNFAEIGEKFPDAKYLSLRFLPALAGTLLPIVIFFLALELGFSRRGAFLAGMLIALDNALVTQSRFILLDSFLLLFGFSALWCYFRYRTSALQAKSYKLQAFWLAAMGILGGMAASIKWTGLTFLALAGIVELARVAKARAFRTIPSLTVPFIVIPLALYFSVFAVHFALLTKSGPGDAFMSQQFQKTLAGSSASARTDIRGSTPLEKFVELNIEMYRSNQRLTATHPYGSPWYSWPFMQRPIFYWVDGGARVYLLGNPLIWWLSTAAVLLVALGYLLRKIPVDHIGVFLLTGYALNLLPFVGIQRVMFLYHYFTAFIFAVLLLAYVLEQRIKKDRAWLAVIALAVLFFAYFAPLTYGLPLTPNQYQARLWMRSWE